MDTPENWKTKLPKAALRIAMGVLVLLMLSPFFIAAIPHSDPDPNDLSLADQAHEEFIGQLFAAWAIVTLADIIATLILSAICIRIAPALARTATLLVCGAMVFGLIILPALARAREKPVIYLYPESETTVNVKLHYAGTLEETIPHYGPDGWTVRATPNGELTDLATGQTFPYLFWEGKDNHVFEFTSGFVVPGPDSESFLRDKLNTLGLNPTEINDFIEYWSPRMQRHPYNLVRFETTEFDQLAPLQITPTPDTLIRIFMVFRPLPAPITLPKQTLPTHTRTGFTAVEWGGTEQR